MTASSPRLSIPGSFISDGALYDRSLPPKLDINVGTLSHIFRPPNTPSAASSLHLSTTSVTERHAERSSKRSRKRHLSDTLGEVHSTLTPTSLGDDFSFSPSLTGKTPEHVTDRMSPIPFANTRYTLRGGSDTPTSMAAAAVEMKENSDRALDKDFRRAWAVEENLRGHDADDCDDFDNFSSTPDKARRRRSLNREFQLSSGTSTARTDKDSWGSTVVNIVGGVAGRVWHFCRAGGFTGFYAGGGQGYKLPQSEDGSLGSSWQVFDASSDGQSRAGETFSKSVPGCFPVEDFIEDYMSREQTPTRPTKRVQREKGGGGELRGNWLMVSSGNSPQIREASPLHTSGQKKFNGRYGSPSIPAASRFTASRAGRRSVGGGCQSPARASRISHAGSPAQSASRPASTASPRLRSSPAALSSRSPVPAEAQRLVKKRRREERETDASIRRFNDQLRAMIKEGKEALGSTVEVEEYGEDAGVDIMDEGF
ncbi:MAG: hypothetical protein M1825_005703 [Sarcosagium campestre]|nr:MAG: hypothetical protein M1825_005703 [Sarcosagium campestre]